MSKAAALCLVLVLESGAVLAQGASSTGGGAENWIVSETTSPLDYAPVIIASAWSSERANSPAMQLSIQCRRGRTDLVIVSPALTGRPEDYRVSYAVNDGRPVNLVSGLAASGTGIAIREDVVRLLTGLPARGEIGFQFARPQAAPPQPALQARYDLGPLKTVLERIAGPCKWPAPAPAPPKAQPQ